jgi:hypothetical protein
VALPFAIHIAGNRHIMRCRTLQIPRLVLWVAYSLQPYSCARGPSSHSVMNVSLA